MNFLFGQTEDARNRVRGQYSVQTHECAYQSKLAMWKTTCMLSSNSKILIVSFSLLNAEYQVLSLVANVNFLMFLYILKILYLIRDEMFTKSLPVSKLETENSFGGIRFNAITSRLCTYVRILI